MRRWFMGLMALLLGGGFGGATHLAILALPLKRRAGWRRRRPCASG